MMDENFVNQSWLAIAVKIGSYRQMYALSEEIVCHTSASVELRQAAGRVRNELRPIIDKPIAPAKQLSRARYRFQVLTALLSNSA